MVGNRKWKLALWGMSLGTVIAGIATIGWWIGKAGAAGMLGQGLGIVTLVFGGYAAANVSQKSVTRSPDSPAVGGKNGGENE